jgi:uncharacterized protein involved in outer membrane biogenesis
MKIPRPLKILGIAVGALIVLALILPYVISVDSFRPKITSMIEEKTGRKVTIGNIRARFIPHIGFTVSDVSLGSPSGFGDVNLVKVDAIKGALAWGPLLHGDYELDSLELDHPVVVLADDDHGHTNYDFSSVGTKPGAAKQVNVDKPFELSSVDVSNAEVTSGRVAGSQHTLLPSMKITGLNVHLGDITTQAGATKLWTGTIPLSGLKLEMSGLKAPLTFNSGELNLKEGHLDGTFAGEMGSALKAKGELHVPKIEQPVADVYLSTPLLDLDQLAGAGGKDESAPRATAAEAPRKGELVAVIKAKADRVRYSPYEGTGAQGTVKVYDNRVEAPLTMAFYGGSLGVTARLDTAQTPQRFSANIQVAQVDMDKLLSVDPGTKGKMTGHGEIKMQILGTLDKNLTNSLTGDGNFALRDGTLPGVNVGQSMQALAKVEKFLSLGQSGGGPGGQTTFSLIAGDLSIKDARLYTKTTHADTNMGSGDIHGSLGFNQTLNMTGQWSLPPAAGGALGAIGGVAATANPVAGILGGVLGGAAQKQGGILSVPFTLGGTIKDPKMTPGGMPSMKGGTTQSSTTQQQPQKKSILDIFKKP